MKTKLILLSILSLVSTSSFAAYDYTGAFDKAGVEVTDPSSHGDEYQEGELSIDIRDQFYENIGITDHQQGNGDSIKYTLTEKVMIPKKDKLLFIKTSKPDVSLEDVKNLPIGTENMTGINPKSVLHMNGNVENNKPIFYYAYDKTNNKLYKIYKKNGERFVTRITKSAGLETLTKEQIESPDFKMTDGFVKANEMPKLAIGEIKEATSTDYNDSKNYVKDRANWAVSGDTVYKYIKGLKIDATPVDGVISKDNELKDHAVSGKTLYDYLEQDKSLGEVEKGNQHLITGDKVYGVLDNERTNGDVAPGNNYFVTGDKVHKALDEIKSQNKVQAAGVSTAIAIANIPTNFTESKPNTIGVGTGYYGGHFGVAVGYARKLIDNSMTIKLNAAFNTASEFGGGAGLGYSW